MEENNSVNYIDSEDIYVGKYLRYTTKKYEIEKNGNKNTIAWECVYRTNLADFKSVYGSEVIALMKNIPGDSDTHILLIENYRFPVEKKILELPSGLIDPEEYGSLEKLYRSMQAEVDEHVKKGYQDSYDELLKEVAIKSGQRELKEETGYTGTFQTFLTLPKYNPIKLFANIFYDPWKCLENAAFSIFNIDMSMTENQNPVQQLDSCEVIKTHKVKLSELLDFISEKVENEGYGVSTHLYFLAVGLRFSDIVKNTL
jgi:8-oxo-dGTP pyrophosphatase MutT (NUDIX family)